MKKVKYFLFLILLLFSVSQVSAKEITRTCKYEDSIGNDVVVSFDENDRPTAYIRTYCKSEEDCEIEEGQGKREDIRNWKSIEAVYKNNKKCFSHIALVTSSSVDPNTYPEYIVYDFNIYAGFHEGDIIPKGYILRNYQLELYYSSDEEDVTPPNEDDFNTESPDYDVNYPIKDTDMETICSMPSYRKPMKFVGVILRLVKILVPILIIVYGAYDLYKAMVSSKDDEIKKAIKSIGIRIVAGLFIFLLPGILQVLLNMINEWSEYKNSWCCCTECLFNKDCDVNSCNSSSCHIEGMGN